MAETKPFFTEHCDTIRDFAKKIDLVDIWKGPNPNRALRSFLENLCQSPEEYDEWCRNGVEKDGANFLRAVKGNPTSETIFTALKYCGRFAYEKYFRRGTGSVQQSDVELFAWFSPQNTDIPPDHLEDTKMVWPLIALEFTHEGIQRTKFDIAQIIGHGEAQAAQIKRFQEKFEEWSTNASKMLGEYDERAQRLRSKYNFVGLSHAFIDQASKAKWRKYASFSATLIFGSFSSLLFCVPLWFSRDHLAEIIQGTATEQVLQMTLNRGLYMLTAVVPLVALFVYFFRLSYVNYKSAGAIQLQFEHRHAICAFIEAYARYKKGLGDFNMEKFEAMIFSGVTPDPGNIPATFEGAEGVIKVLDAVRANKAGQ